MKKIQTHRGSTIANGQLPGKLIKVLKQAKRRSWLEFGWRFPEEKDCLAAFLALETAEVLAGEKPANLLRISYAEQPCGRNLYLLWQRHGQELMTQSPLTVVTCRQTHSEILLLFYHPQTLQRRLSGRVANSFLQRCGYPQQADPEELLNILCSRFEQGTVPHEIGFFLGYPTKDVAAFLGWRKSPPSDQCGWVVYGKTRRSLALAERYANCRKQMFQRLANDDSPAQLIAIPAPY